MATSHHNSIVAVIVWLMIGCTSRADEGMLNVDLAAASPRVRTNAPINLLWQVQWLGSSILQGRFELDYFAAGQLRVCHCTSSDIVLQPGQQTVRMSLPTAGSIAGWAQGEVALKFVTSERTFDLTQKSRYPLMTVSAGRRFGICVITARNENRRPNVEDQLIQALRLQSLLPKPENEQDTNRPQISTNLTYWERDDLPASSIYYCSFDVVVIAQDLFATLRRRQLEALSEWTRAGGSLVVHLSPDVESPHIAFLNDLLHEETSSPPFLLNTDGQFVVASNQAKQAVWLAQTGLGRAAVVQLDQLPLDETQRHPTLRKIASHVWKLRYDPLANRTLAGMDRPDLRLDPSSRSQSMGQFMSRLMPKEVRIVPVRVIGLVLFLYLILVGPVDYFVLGFFKLRRFTWLTFPLITLATAVLCVNISNSYLSSETNQRSLIIQDLGPNGDVLRENQLTLLFMGSRTVVKSELQNAICTPMDPDSVPFNQGYGTPFRGRRSSPMRRDSPSYIGAMPVQYELRQMIDQWSPQVNRFLTLSSGGNVDFDWEVEGPLTSRRERQKLRDRVLRRWPRASVFLLNEDREHHLAGGAVFPVPNHRDDFMYWRRGRSAQPNAFLFELCRQPPRGLFRYVSQISPAGGDSLGDIAVLDESDPSKWLLVIAVEDGKDLIIYRRLYTQADRI